MHALSYTLMHTHPPEPMAARLRTGASLAPAPPLSVDTLGRAGNALQRPECVLATAAGELYVADWRGGVTHIHPDGTQSQYLGKGPDGLALKPNGIALLRDGSFLLAQLGASDGGVYQLQRDGQVAPWLMTVQGQDLPPTNFIVQGGDGRFWVSVSTRRQPRALGYRADCDDGFIVCVDHRGARIVADGLGYTNEVALHPSGAWLYANETFARRLSRFALHADGSLGARETVTSFGEGSFPDGLGFDEEGHAWVVSIVSNRLIRVAADGKQTLWLEDSDEAHLRWVEAAYLSGTMDRPHLDGVKSRRLRNISSLAFTGADRRTGVLGCLLGDCLHTLAMPAAGVAPTHWHF
jgi:sugar lactone lactonase YvrE